jgi:hypothetical protein
VIPAAPALPSNVAAPNATSQSAADVDAESDDELTRYRASQRVSRSAPEIVPSASQAPSAQALGQAHDAGDDEDELTTFRPERALAAHAARVSAGRARVEKEAEEQAHALELETDDEPTVFQAEGQNERPTLPAPDDEDEPTRLGSLEKNIGAGSRPGGPAFEQSFENEKTEWLNPDDPNNSLELVDDDATANPASAQPAAGDAELNKLAAQVEQVEQVEEEATKIFFSTEDGIGLVDEPSPARSPRARPAGPGPLQAPPPAGRGPKRTAQPSARPYASQVLSGRAGAAGAITTTITTGTGPYPVSATTQRLPMAAMPTLQLPTSALPGRPTLLQGSTPYLIAAGVLVIMSGLVLSTPLGVTLGLRRPTHGTIEVRTAPQVAANVRLDGIYRGRAPLRLEMVPAGKRVLALEADGYEPVSVLVALEGGDVVQENVSLNQSAAAAR